MGQSPHPSVIILFFPELFSYKLLFVFIVEKLYSIASYDGVGAMAEALAAPAPATLSSETGTKHFLLLPRPL